jgi:hypothetical protein
MAFGQSGVIPLGVVPGGNCSLFLFWRSVLVVPSFLGVLDPDPVVELAPLLGDLDASTFALPAGVGTLGSALLAGVS